MQWKTILTGLVVASVTIVGQAASLDAGSGRSLHLPESVHVFDARHMPTKTGERNLLVSDEEFQRIAETMKDRKEEVAEAREMLKHLNIYQLSGRDDRDLHTAYVFHLKFPTSAYRLNEKEKALYQSLYGMESSSYPMVYDRGLYYRIRSKELKALHGENASASVLNERLQEILEVMRHRALIDMEASGMTKDDIALQLAIMKLYGATIRDGQMNQKVTLLGDLGYYSRAHMVSQMDAFQWPLYVMSFNRFGDDAEYGTILMTNDTSAAFWKPILEKAFLVKGEE